MAALNLMSQAAKTRFEDVGQYEDQGRTARTLAGSHIADLVSLKKTILLCSACSPKFNSARNGYVTNRTMPLCVAKCDGCKEPGSDRHVYLHHQNMPRL